MSSAQSFFRRASLYTALGSAVAALISIAACQILMGLALAALLVSGEKLRFPPIKLPLALFFLGTVLSLTFSADPAAGWPQIRKLSVFVVILLVYTLFRELRVVERLIAAWIGVASVSAGLALVQFHGRWEQARALHVPFYDYYIGQRITGFMSHWMTFGGEMMIVLVLLAAFLFFGAGGRKMLIAGIACAVILSAAVVLSFTRSIWLGSLAGGFYLLWCWHKRLIVVLPVALVLIFWVGPDSLRERFDSFLYPHGQPDSNQHRIVTFRTGWEMIKANPWFGVGLEQVGPRFDGYVPADVPRPLPLGWYGHLHNIYLQYAAERGVPTLLALLWLIGKIIFDFLRALRRRAAGSGAWFLRGAVAVVIAILTEGLFEMNLGDTEVLTMFLIVMACGYVVLDRTESRSPAATG